MNAKTFVYGALVAASMAAMLPANAAPTFPTYVVDPGALSGTVHPFTANDLGGQYNEVVTFTSATTFTVSLDFIGGNFSLDDPINPVTYNSTQSGLGSKYGLYALFTGQGSYATVSGVTTFTLQSGLLNLYLDPNNNTGFTTPPNGGTAYGTTNSGDDVLLGTSSGKSVTGSGTSNNSCSGNNCGSFGQTTGFALTAAGSNFFISPSPFYNMALTSGQFEGIIPVIGQNAYSTGTANTVFNSAVPEPSALALAGIALAGLGFASRRKARK